MEQMRKVFSSEYIPSCLVASNHTDIQSILVWGVFFKCRCTGPQMFFLVSPKCSGLYHTYTLQYIGWRWQLPKDSIVTHQSCGDKIPAGTLLLAIHFYWKRAGEKRVRCCTGDDRPSGSNIFHFQFYIYHCTPYSSFTGLDLWSCRVASYGPIHPLWARSI